MAEYFREAVKCDKTIAAISPVPIYVVDDEPKPVSDAGNATISPVVDASGPSALHSSIANSRAAYDVSHSKTLRVETQRETNVLIHLAKREAQQQTRQAEVDRLTKDLIQRIEEERMADAAAAPDEGADTNKVASKIVSKKQLGTSAVDSSKADDYTSFLDGPLHGVKTGRQLTDLIHSVLSDDTANGLTRGSSKKDIEFYERIKMEEIRILKNKLVSKRTGGIAAMYNQITLEEAASSDNTVDAYSSALIPEKITDLLKDGHGRASVDELQSRRGKDVAALGERLSSLKQQEHAEMERLRRQAQQKDAERQKMLTELVSQDKLRRKLQREEREAMEALEAASNTVASFHNASANVSQISEVMQSMLLAKRKPPHPIDVYQLNVRQDMGLPAKY